MMRNEGETNYFQMCLTCYNLSGLRSSSKPFLKIISQFILYPVMWVLFGMMTYNIRFKHNNLSEITEVFIAVCTTAYILLRKTILIKNSALYEDLIKEQSRFWKYDLFGEPTESKLRKNMQFCVSLIKLIVISGIMSTVVHCSSPFLVENIDLPQSCWIPGNNSIVKNIIYVAESAIHIECLNYLAVFDGLYLLTTTNLKAQFVLLQKAIESITFKSGDEETYAWTQLKACSQYHIYLLRIHKKINKIYSEFFLCTYILTIWGTCVPLFVIFNNISNFAEVVESMFIAFLINALLVMMFIPASEIEIEAEKLALQIYFINWYETKNLKIHPANRIFINDFTDRSYHIIF
ncbi:odorant receptor 149 [Tribolium castaneum]|uniref:Odorant receptor n=1 Tax=Tribolium castaneum TaxID=7070 RepID=D6WN67_TRICA|nr:odorant receptor 149 [Tribolium castaneum]